MTPCEILKDGVVLRWDNQPLKTKIIATIGSPASYEKGIYGLDLEREQSPLTYEYLIRNLLSSGATVIRLNMAYVEDESAVRSFFQSLRSCVSELRRFGPSAPCAAVLTDLPGPRIRFTGFPKTKYQLERGALFEVHLTEAIEGTRERGSVCIGEKPLREAYPRPQDYVRMMNHVIQRAESDEDIRVIVGDGDLILTVDNGKLLAGTRQRHTGSEPPPVLPCKVIKKGRIGNDRFTIKNVDLEIPSFTDDDKKKLDLLLEGGALEAGGMWAFVGLSFAQGADDLLRARRFIEKKMRDHLKGAERAKAELYAPALIAKIETDRGFRKKNEILDVADGLMVARGDLGVQRDIEKIASAQKALIGLCRKRGKLAITATEMLTSMQESPEPRRAEVTDVFNAILDGSDAVMLSGETSSGQYPFHAVRKMARIAAEAEWFHDRGEMSTAENNQARSQRRDGGSPEGAPVTETYNDTEGTPDEVTRRLMCLRRYQEFLGDAEQVIEGVEERLDQRLRELESGMRDLRGRKDGQSELEKCEWRHALYIDKWRRSRKQRTTDAISQAACSNSECNGIRALVVVTTTGRSARMISRFRPTGRIIGAVHDSYNAHKLLLSYGVTPVEIGKLPGNAGPGDMFAKVAEVMIRDGMLPSTQGVVLTCGSRPEEPGTTNTIQIQESISALAAPAER